ncbi:MAG: hypothetical protein KAX31_03580, partial [Thermoplasmata archaeon]|nr:hypothetical protein [Thermoplasmata archaeon]
MESGAPGWSYTGNGLGVESEWHVSNHNPYSPVNSWYFGREALWTYDASSAGQLFSPYIYLPAGSIFAQMDMWHWYDFWPTWEGGLLDVTTDNGISWQRITPEDGYDGIINPGWGCPIEGNDAFTGASGGYVHDVFDLSPYIGSVIKLRWWMGGITLFGGYEGWYVDDVTIICPEYGCQWIPASQSSFGSQGEVMTYSMDLRNIGRFPDTFTFTTTTTLGWPVDVYDDAWNPVVDSGALGPGAFSLFYANVTIPLAALGTDTETTVITATSGLDPSYWGNETLSTLVLDPVLLVSDDWEWTVELGWFDALDANSFGGFYGYDWIDVSTMGLPTLEAMEAHQIVIWHTQGVGAAQPPYDSRNCLDDAERTLLGQYCDNGGLLYIAGPMAVASFFQAWTGWCSQYMGMTGTHWWPWLPGADNPVQGSDGNPIGDGLSFMYGGSWGHCVGEGASCAGGADGNFDVAFTAADGNCIGTSLDDGTTRRVITNFDPTNVDTPAMRDLLLQRILNFLLPPPYGLSMIPSYQFGYAFAGDTVTYDLNITNIGTNDDIYDIFVGLGPMGWITNVFEEDGVTPLTDNGGIPGEVDTGIVLVGGYYNIVVEVQVDVLAIPGDIDTADIVAESFGGGGEIAVQSLIDTMIPNLILLVDDDDSINNGGPYNTYAVEDASQPVGTPYADALTALGYDYDLYVVPSGADGPDLETLLYHPVVIWLCGYEWGWEPSLTSADQNNLATFLDNGGKLWLNGPMIIYDFFGFGGPTTVSPGSFFYDYLKISDTYITNNLPPNPLVGDPASIFAGASYGAASVWPTSWTGEVNILPLPDSLGGFASPSATLPYSANTYENGYQMCYLEFEFAFISAAADQSDCAWRILNWMMPNEGVSLTPNYQSWYGSPGSFVWYN